MLQAIENQVLDEVSISRLRRAVVAALATALAAAASVWWLEETGKALPYAANRVPAAAAVALLGSAVISAAAVRLSRYRWCCAAAHGCGLAAVIGIGAFWWVRTGPTGIGLSWLVFADLTAVALTVGWLAIILTPIERSQPDMRARSGDRSVRPAK
ncbi:hypothetical protein B2J96_09510 [Mycobacterium shigaense]|nr:hypothetical protein B2J96_09510 [Mycobacterium shigaense]